MVMDWRDGVDIMSMLHGLQEKIRATVGSSSTSVLEHVRFQPPRQINDYVYEICNPTKSPTKRPSVEIVFFHGLQLEDSSSKDAHIITWLSRDKTDLWLNWLFEDFSDARILTISYDAFPRRTNDQGRMEMYLTCENLLHSFIGNEAKVGQDGCPVVLVGHCLGGLVMKELCVQANSELSLNRLDRPNEAAKNFLWNVKGLSTYATPHHGSRLADIKLEFQKGALFEDLTTLNPITQRRNEDFRKLQEKYGWKAFGVVETREVTLGKSFAGIVVSEASGRHDVDGFSTITDADHFDVCRPKFRTSNNFQLLSNFIGDILKKDKVSNTCLLGDVDDFVGLEARVEIILKELYQAKRLGIVGMGGIGKITLAKAVFDKISGSFEYACFLDDVKNKMAGQESPESLREKIKGNLMHRGRNVSNSFGWRELNGKRVLIILDDAECGSQVKVMTKQDGFSEESRVIVTSRDQGFLRPEDFDIHNVGGLDLDDSKRLFCLHAFKQPWMPPAYEAYKERVTKFVKKCGGLPLALKMLGSYLYKQENKAIWDDGLEKLSHAQPLNGSLNKDGLFSILRVSYDSLASSEREMFLDVATFLYRKDLEEAEQVWRVCSWASVDSGLQNLKDKGLVSVHANTISMHEVLRDMGRDIAGHTRASLIPEEFLRLSQKEKAAVKVLKLFSPDAAFHGTFLSAGFFAGLEELQILWLKGISVFLDGPVGHLPPKLVFLNHRGIARGPPVSLALKHWLFARLLDCRWNFPIIMDSTSIWCAFLCCNWEDLRPLHESDLVIFRIQSLRSVILHDQVMEHLSSSWCLLSQLERLEIVYCPWLRTLPGNFGQLQELRYLKVRSCSSFEALPDSFARLSQLEHLEIVECDWLRTLPGNFGQLRELHYLKVMHCGSLEGLPDSFARLSQLERLEIDRCDSLATLPGNFGQLRELRYLEVMHCELLEGLPDSFACLSQLERLEIDGCDWLATLPGNFGQLRALRYLSVKRCWSLEGLPDSFARLSSLEHLEFRDCRKLRISLLCLFDLPALQHLHIASCNGITGGGWYELKVEDEHSWELSEVRHLSIRELNLMRKEKDNFAQESKTLVDAIKDIGVVVLGAQLEGGFPEDELSSKKENKKEYELSSEEYEVSYCGSLAKLPKSFGQPQRLQCLKIYRSTGEVLDLRNFRELPHLAICDSESLELPTSIEQLLALRHLEIRGWECLKALPNTLGRLEALKQLKISKCSFLTDLKSLGKLQALEQLTIHACKNLTKLPECVGQLRALRHLEIRDCRSLKALPKTLEHLQALEELAIDECWGLENLPESMGQLLALRHLEIRNCNSLETLPNVFTQLQALERLTIRKCRRLRELPESMGQLLALRHLEIRKCASLETLPNIFTQLQALERLTITPCAWLRELPESLGQLLALQHLEIRKCASLETLPNIFTQLQALERLMITACDWLRELPESLGQLLALRHLEISECASLETLPNSFMQLQALEQLTITDCLRLRELPESMGQLLALRHLEIRKCASLETLPNSLEQLQSLEELAIVDCLHLTEPPKWAGQLGAQLHLCFEYNFETSESYELDETFEISEGSL